jgi:hypothetical protein
MTFLQVFLFSVVCLKQKVSEDVTIISQRVTHKKLRSDEFITIIIYKAKYCNITCCNEKWSEIVAHRQVPGSIKKIAIYMNWCGIKTSVSINKNKN